MHRSDSVSIQKNSIRALKGNSTTQCYYDVTAELYDLRYFTVVDVESGYRLLKLDSGSSLY